MSITSKETRLQKKNSVFDKLDNEFLTWQCNETLSIDKNKLTVFIW